MTPCRERWRRPGRNRSASARGWRASDVAGWHTTVMSGRPPGGPAQVGVPHAGARRPPSDRPWEMRLNTTPSIERTESGSDSQSVAAPVVVVDEATVRFSDQLAVDGISLAVPPGSILGLI